MERYLVGLQHSPHPATVPLLQLLKQVLLVTVDLRHYLLSHYSAIAAELLHLVLRLTSTTAADNEITHTATLPPAETTTAINSATATTPSTALHSSNGSLRDTGMDTDQYPPDFSNHYFSLPQDQHTETLEWLVKVVSDMILVAESTMIHPLFHPSFRLLDAMENLILYPSVDVLDPTLRLLSYLYEFCSDSNTILMDAHHMWDTILQKSSTHSDVVLPILQHLASHLIPRVPSRYSIFANFSIFSFLVFFETIYRLTIP
jgi:hypothetical protein